MTAIFLAGLSGFALGYAWGIPDDFDAPRDDVRPPRWRVPLVGLAVFGFALWLGVMIGWQG